MESPVSLATSLIFTTLFPLKFLTDRKLFTCPPAVFFGIIITKFLNIIQNRIYEQGGHMKTTIKDIARDTGLSLATISKYLNHKKISEKNRILIEESIRRNQYTHNSNAQALRSKSSHCICIFMPSIQDYYFGKECDHIIKAMHEKGYSVLVRSYSDEANMKENDIAFLKNRHIDGVVLFAQVTFPPLLIAYLSSNGIPFVCMHQKPALPAFLVSYDNSYAGETAAEYLLQKGHRKILLVGLDSYSTNQKTQHFISTYQKYGFDPSNLTVTLFPSSEFVEDYTLPVPIPGDPTAIVFMDHFTSLPLMKALLHQEKAQACGYSILAFEDDPIFESLVPAVTTFTQDAKTLGYLAANLLYEQILGNNIVSDSCLAPVSLTERESVHTCSY